MSHYAATLGDATADKVPETEPETLVDTHWAM